MLQVSHLISLVLAVTSADVPKSDIVLRMTCQMRDGSAVAGDIAPTTTVKLATGFGELKVPLWRVHRITFADDRETAKLYLSNEDRVTGFFETDGFSVETQPGREVLVRLPNVRECTLRVSDRPVAISTAYASGHWTKMPPSQAIDKNATTLWNSGGWKGWIELDLGKAEAVTRARFTVAHNPPGRSQWNVYLSKQPMRAQRGAAELIKTVRGSFRPGSVIEVEFPIDVQGRFLQVHCPQSVSWVMIYELEVFTPRRFEKGPDKP